jgi:hypothetical protein
MSRLLQEKFGHTDETQAGLLSILSGGRLGYAMDEGLIEQRDWSFSIFTQMLGSGEEEIWEDKESMENWFDWSQLLLRDIAAYKATGRTDLLINEGYTKISTRTL